MKFNILSPRQNGRYFPNDIFFNENILIQIEISIKFVHNNNNIATLAQIMAWRPPGAKPLSDPVMVRLSRQNASLVLNELISLVLTTADTHNTLLPNWDLIATTFCTTHVDTKGPRHYLPHCCVIIGPILRNRWKYLRDLYEVWVH